MAGQEHRENHLVDLPSPTPLEATGEHSHQLHRHRGTAFVTPATVGPPQRTAKGKRIHTRVTSDPVIFAQHEESAHAPVRLELSGR